MLGQIDVAASSRREELGLMWSGYAPDARTLRVTHAVKRIKNREAGVSRKTKLVVTELKTKKSRRTLCLTPELVDAIRAHRTALNVCRPGSSGPSAG